jgi:hypothetical protein
MIGGALPTTSPPPFSAGRTPGHEACCEACGNINVTIYSLSQDGRPGSNAFNLNQASEDGLVSQTQRPDKPYLASGVQEILHWAGHGWLPGDRIQPRW